MSEVFLWSTTSCFSMRDTSMSSSTILVSRSAELSIEAKISAMDSSDSSPPYLELVPWFLSWSLIGETQRIPPASIEASASRPAVKITRSSGKPLPPRVAVILQHGGFDVKPRTRDRFGLYNWEGSQWPRSWRS